MLEWDEEAQKAKKSGQSVAEMKEALLAIAASQNAHVEKQKKKGLVPKKELNTRNKRNRAKK